MHLVNNILIIFVNVKNIDNDKNLNELEIRHEEKSLLTHIHNTTYLNISTDFLFNILH